MRKILIAHRGSTLPYLENTVDGIKKAIDNSADFVELDFRSTRDGEIVAFHDSHVGRLTNGKGKVAKLSLAELRNLSLRIKFGRYAWHIPTYNECIDVIDDKIGLLC